MFANWHKLGGATLHFDISVDKAAAETDRYSYGSMACCQSLAEAHIQDRIKVNQNGELTIMGKDNSSILVKDAARCPFCKTVFSFGISKKN